MKKLLLGLALVALPLSAATAQSMNAETFYKRSSALMKKGPLAIFSRGEIRVLMKEAQAAGMAARAQRLAAIQAGKEPAYCPPKSADKIGTEEFMKRLGAIPAAERAKMNMTQAMTRIFAAKFPCRG